MENTLITLRILEENANEIPDYNDFLKENNITPLTVMMSKTKEQLIEFLTQYKLSISPTDITLFSSKSFLAQDLAKEMIADQQLAFENLWDEEMVSAAITLLWNKIQTPPVEMFDLHIHDGYQCLEMEEHEKAIKHWQEASSIMLNITQSHSPSEVIFKDAFENNFLLAEWINDYNEILFQFADDKVIEDFQNFLEGVIAHFRNSKVYFLEAFYLNYVQTFYYLGKPQKGDLLYQQYLTERPKWKNGWLLWANNYSTSTFNIKDEENAVRILCEALEKIDANEKAEVLLRLKHLYNQLGWIEKGSEVDAELEKLPALDDIDDYVEGDFGIDDIKDEKLKELIQKHGLSDDDIKKLID